MKTIIVYVLALTIFVQSAFAAPSMPIYIALTPEDTGNTPFDYSKVAAQVRTDDFDYIYDTARVVVFAIVAYSYFGHMLPCQKWQRKEALEEKALYEAKLAQAIKDREASKNHYYDNSKTNKDQLRIRETEYLSRLYYIENKKIKYLEEAIKEIDSNPDQFFRITTVPTDNTIDSKYVGVSSDQSVSEEGKKEFLLNTKKSLQTKLITSRTEFLKINQQLGLENDKISAIHRQRNSNLGKLFEIKQEQLNAVQNKILESNQELSSKEHNLLRREKQLQEDLSKIDQDRAMDLNTLLEQQPGVGQQTVEEYFNGWLAGQIDDPTPRKKENLKTFKNSKTDKTLIKGQTNTFKRVSVAQNQINNFERGARDASQVASLLYKTGALAGVFFPTYLYLAFTKYLYEKSAIWKGYLRFTNKTFRKVTKRANAACHAVGTQGLAHENFKLIPISLTTERIGSGEQILLDGLLMEAADLNFSEKESRQYYALDAASVVCKMDSQRVETLANILNPPKKTKSSTRSRGIR